MSKIFRTLSITLFLIFFSFSVCSAEEITDYNNLIEKGKAFDGKQVTIKGEVIKEAMVRGNYAWINVSDGSNAMGVWLKSSEINKLSMYGDYKHKGDTVEVTGTFNRDCSEHGGDMDIHASSIEVISKGEDVPHIIAGDKIKTTVLLSFVTISLFMVYLRRRFKKVKLLAS